MWRYADDSAQFLFAGLDDIELDPIAQKISRRSPVVRRRKRRSSICLAATYPTEGCSRFSRISKSEGSSGRPNGPTAGKPGRPETVWELDETNERNELRN